MEFPILSVRFFQGQETWPSQVPHPLAPRRPVVLTTLSTLKDYVFYVCSANVLPARECCLALINSFSLPSIERSPTLNFSTIPHARALRMGGIDCDLAAAV